MRIDLLSPAPPDEPETVARARAYFYGEATSTGALPDDVAEALVEALVRNGSGDRLAALAATTDKAVAKRARRGLHVLRSRGIAVEVPRTAARAPSLASAPEPEPTSLASVVVRDGEQVVWFTRSGAEGRVDIFQAQIRDSFGLLSVESLRATRKQWRLVAHEFCADTNLLVAPVDGAHARWLIEEAALRSVALGRQPPRSYSEARVPMGPVQAPARHPVEALVGEERIAEAAATPLRFARVLELPEGARFIPPEDLLQKAALQLEDVSTSQLLVDEQQRAQQAREVITRAAREALAGPWRARLAHQLRETALVTARRAEVGGRGRDHLADAATFVAAARQLEDAAVPAEDIVLAHRMFERVLEAGLRKSP